METVNCPSFPEKNMTSTCLSPVSEGSGFTLIKAVWPQAQISVRDKSGQHRRDLRREVLSGLQRLLFGTAHRDHDAHHRAV